MATAVTFPEITTNVCDFSGGKLTHSSLECAILRFADALNVWWGPLTLFGSMGTWAIIDSLIPQEENCVSIYRFSLVFGKIECHPRVIEGMDDGVIIGIHGMVRDVEELIGRDERNMFRIYGFNTDFGAYDS